MKKTALYVITTLLIMALILTLVPLMTCLINNTYTYELLRWEVGIVIWDIILSISYFITYLYIEIKK